MAVIVEGDIQITLPTHATFRRFDEGSSHGLSHCMKAVDYIIELDDRIIFIEFKDPDNPKAKTEKRKAFFVMNLAAWNKQLADFPATRIST